MHEVLKYWSMISCQDNCYECCVKLTGSSSMIEVEIGVYVTGVAGGSNGKIWHKGTIAVEVWFYESAETYNY